MNLVPPNSVRVSKSFPIFTESRRQLSGGGDRVAIIMRTKDRPILLARALASVLSQIHQNWHLYLVNDGGDPAPVQALLSDFETSLDSRITIIHNEKSLGMEGASNKALALSEGQFVAVHDDDDSWHPRFLSATVAFLKTKNGSKFIAVAAQPEIIWERIEHNRCFEIRRESYRYWDWAPVVDFASVLNRNFLPPISLLIRMDAVREVGEFNSDLPVLGDWDYMLRLMSVGDIGTISESLAYYHHREQKDEQYGNSIITGLDKHKTYETFYRNNLIRAALSGDSNLGLLHTFLRSSETDDLERQIERLQRKIDPLEWKIDHVGRNIDRLNEQIHDRFSALESKDDWAAHNIAREVWFEKQRWGLPYKISKWVRSRLFKKK